MIINKYHNHTYMLFNGDDELHVQIQEDKECHLHGLGL